MPRSIATDGDADWTPCPIYKYKTTKLPRGTESCHLDFKPVKFQPQKGPKRKTDEQLKEEAHQMLLKKEEKILSSEVSFEK